MPLADLQRHPATAHARRLAALFACLLGGPAIGAPQEVPPPIPPIASTADLGVVVQNRLVQCRDGTYSALIGKRAVWTFGDTCLKKAGVDGQRFIDNSLAWNTDLDASAGIRLDRDDKDATGVPRRFIPFTDGELAYNAANPDHPIALWPGQLVDDPDRRRVLIFYGAIVRGDDGAFTPIGSGIAVSDPQFKQVTRPPENPKKKIFDPNYLWGAGQQAYGGGYVKAGDMLYCFGGQAVGLSTHVHVARVPLAGALDKSQWTYWNGTDWSPDDGPLATVYQGGAAGDTVFWDAWLGVYVTVYQRYLDDTVYYRVANHPEGPWSAEAVMFVAQQGTDPSYAARVHTEYEENGGEVEYVTYAKTTGFLQQELPLTRVTFGAMPRAPAAR